MTKKGAEEVGRGKIMPGLLGHVRDLSLILLGIQRRFQADMCQEGFAFFKEQSDWCVESALEDMKTDLGHWLRRHCWKSWQSVVVAQRQEIMLWLKWWNKHVLFSLMVWLDLGIHFRIFRGMEASNSLRAIFQVCYYLLISLFLSLSLSLSLSLALCMHVHTHRETYI